MSQKCLIDLAQLVEDISKVVLKSAFAIKEISQTFSEVFFKDDQLDPVTEADYLVQQTITDFLLIKYPGLQIVGEQNIGADDDICKKVTEKAQVMSFHQIDLNKLIQKYPIKKNSVFVNLSEICLWIDPLDCTRGFISNKKQEVTILVGVTQNHRPIAGVIGQPFKLDSSNKCIFNPRVFIGSELFVRPNEKKFAYEYKFLSKSWKKWQQFDTNKHGYIERRVAISSRRIPNKQHSLMEKIKMEKHEIGGAGSKFIKLIKKEVGTLMFIDVRTSMWDSCAGEAIIKAMGGFFIKPNLEQIIYDPKSQYRNNEGFISSLSPNVFSQIQNYIATEEFRNFAGISQATIQLSQIDTCKFE